MTLRPKQALQLPLASSVADWSALSFFPNI